MGHSWSKPFIAGRFNLSQTHRKVNWAVMSCSSADSERKTGINHRQPESLRGNLPSHHSSVIMECVFISVSSFLVLLEVCLWQTAMLGRGKPQKIFNTRSPAWIRTWAFTQEYFTLVLWFIDLLGWKGQQKLHSLLLMSLRSVGGCRTRWPKEGWVCGSF